MRQKSGYDKGFVHLPFFLYSLDYNISSNYNVLKIIPFFTKAGN